MVPPFDCAQGVLSNVEARRAQVPVRGDGAVAVRVPPALTLDALAPIRRASVRCAGRQNAPRAVKVAKGMMDRPMSSRGLYQPRGTQLMCQSGLRRVFRVVGIGRLRTRVAPNGRHRAGGLNADGDAATTWFAANRVQSAPHSVPKNHAEAGLIQVRGFARFARCGFAARAAAGSWAHSG